MNTYQAMIKARNFIRKPKGWTRGAFQRKRPTGTLAYCAIGAIRQATPGNYELEGTLAGYLEAAMPREYQHMTVMTFNDQVVRTQKRAIAWFQRAVRKAAKAEGLSVQC